jgi:hypothetical protein
MSHTILQIRPAKPKDPDEKGQRGPLYAEPALASLHSLRGKNSEVMLEIGASAGRIAFFVRATDRATRLAESQLYAQYPDIEIDILQNDPFLVNENEEVFSVDLRLTNPEVFPIKRHPQFDDMLARANVDPIAGITSTLARSPVPGMRGHVQICMRPLSSKFRRRALRFLPLLRGGMSQASERYANFFARMGLARGWRRLAYWPIATLMGGFRAWPFIGRFISMPISADAPLPEETEQEHVSARTHDREDDVAAAQDKVNRLLFLCNVRLSVIAPKGNREIAEQKLEEMVGSFQQFALPHSNSFEELKIVSSTQIPHGIQRSPYTLSVEEIATLWHLPTPLVQTPNIDWVTSRKLEPPNDLPIVKDDKASGDLTELGEAVFRGHRSKFGIRTDDRRRHIYIIGKTGMGKSTLLENMIVSDIRKGRGVGVIDPHGDLIDAVQKCIPKERSNDVILFDPSDNEHPISFNVLHCPNPQQRAVTTSGLMSVFTKLWPGTFSGRMEHVLRNTLLALLENEGSSMLGIMRMYADDTYRRKVTAHVTDPLVKSFWDDEYASWSDKYRTEAVAAIQNKVGQLLSTPLIRNIVGQVQSKLSIRDAMDTGKIVLVNLSKGKLGEDASAFIGSMLVTKFQIDAMSRADIPEAERRDFFLYVDEFQNFATESFATILSEARKYRLSLTMANQYVSQLLLGDTGNTALRDAVFGNVGTLVSFQIGAEDAEVFSEQFEEMATPNDILSLPKYHAYMRLMVAGMASKPFSVSTLPPPPADPAAAGTETLRRLSRERYSEKRETVEDKIRRWAVSSSEAKKGAVSDSKAKEKEEEEKEKAKKKGMSLPEYRAWRDRELWTNEFNALRKKKLLGEALTAEEEKQLTVLQQKLEKSGGIPDISKALKEQIEKRSPKE